MLKPSIPELIYKHIFPRPKQNDPTSLASFITRNLVSEVRLEVQTFYGAIDCAEAQYPGLDYTFQPHRARLSRFSGHRKLFRAFDDLKLSDDEILRLCVWEGTRSAKERWERQEGSKIRDTTADGIEVVERKGPPRIVMATPITPVKSLAFAGDEQSDEDETDESVGVQLNQQLLAAAEARSRGIPTVFDPAWEQWMKDALERNELSLDIMMRDLREGRPFPRLGTSSEEEEPQAVQSSPRSTPRASRAARNASRTAATISSTTRTISNLQAALREIQAEPSPVGMSGEGPATARVRAIPRPPTEEASAIARVRAMPRPPTEAAR